ncbi:uncharacterized protein METZ01_LOCUS244676 [marine metagenome]|uniref:Uncharacterized protein n=1 Tax=marine metagenome TaxID=408172 RepID=A0A382HXM2_9ZZZZ
MSTMFAKVKKKSRVKKAVRKTVSSGRNKVAEKKTSKNVSLKISSRFKIDKNNWIVLYYAVAYVGIFGLFVLAIYYSN